VGRAQRFLTTVTIAASLAACGATPPASAVPASAVPASAVPASPTGTIPAATQAAVTRHVDSPFGMDVPASWRDASFGGPSMAHRSVLAFFSTEPISNPCEWIPATTNCPTYAVQRLGADGVLVTWVLHGLGGPVDMTQGEAVTVGGQGGRLMIGAPDEACTAIGGERRMVVDLPGNQPPVFTEMDACYLGPDLDKTEAELRAMLASAK
jgi:hypothetical protein